MSSQSFSDLQASIAAAFLDTATSANVEALTENVDAVLKRLMDEREHQLAAARDPFVSMAQALSAKQKADEFSFEIARLEEAARRLRERVIELKELERQARRNAEYVAAEQERDELARELAAVYPELSERLAELASRLSASDQRLERINNRFLPAGCKFLSPAEAVARGLKGFNDGVVTIPRISVELRLPSFVYKPEDRYTWPRIKF